MHSVLRALADGVALTGEIAHDVPRFLICHGCPRTAEHVARVAQEAARVAERSGERPGAAALAGWLHDVSAVFPAADRADVAHQLGVAVLPEEESFPLIIHQKLSVVLAREVFGITDPTVLDAVGCHTTLRRDPTRLDLVLFVADKIEWDQSGIPPYLDRVTGVLDHSLADAALAYLSWMHERRGSLRVVHPWLRDAYEQLSGQSWGE